jgi:cell division protein FtsI/penicillin-binding protein 2
MTARVEAPYNAWFIGFAPFESPRLAVSVFVENGKSGNQSAAPIAREVLTRSLALPAK